MISVARFLQVQHLLVCLPNEDDDAAVQVGVSATAAASVSGVSGVSGGGDLSWLPVAFLQHGQVLASLDHEAMALVACDDFDLMAVDPHHLEKDIAWLVPEASLARHPPEDLPLRLDSILIGYSAGTGHELIRLTEHYSLKGHSLQAELGSWSQGGGLEVAQSGIWERRTDLNGIVLLGTFVAFPPMSVMGPDGSVIGIIPDIIHAIQKASNFR